MEVYSYKVLFKILFYVYKRLVCMHVYMCTTCIPGACRGQERASDLKIDLQISREPPREC